MSEKRMADARMDELGVRAYPEWKNSDKADLWTEAERARASEAEKEQRLQEQAQEVERLKALATVLASGLERLKEDVAAKDAEIARLTLDADRARERHEIEHATMSREVARLRAELERLKHSGQVEPEDLRQALNAADAKTRSGHVIRQHISALNARISSLSPSGPLAEDVKIALGGVPDGPGGDAERAAVHRLAAGAQSAQAKDKAIKALADALKSFGGFTDSGDLCFCPAFGGHSERCLASRSALRLADGLYEYGAVV